MARRGRPRKVGRAFERPTKVKRWPADRVVRRDPADYQQPSVIAFTRCPNPACRHFTPTRRRWCVVCHMPV